MNGEPCGTETTSSLTTTGEITIFQDATNYGLDAQVDELRISDKAYSDQYFSLQDTAIRDNLLNYQSETVINTGTITTLDATDTQLGSATLNSSFTLGDLDTTTIKYEWWPKNDRSSVDTTTETVYDTDTSNDSFVLSGLQDDKEYVFRAVHDNIWGLKKGDTKAFQTETAPPRVDDLASTADVDPPDTGVHLFWTFSSSDVEFFRIYRSFQTEDTSTATEIDTTGLQPDTITYLDSSVTQGDSYFYYVTAVDTATNEGDSSNVTAAAHITFKKTQDDTDSHRPGDTIVYTIQYVNDGFAPTGKLILADAIPDSVTLSDTAEVTSGPSTTIEYYNDNTMTWQSSSFPRTAITRIRWTVNQDIDPGGSGFEGTARFINKFN